MGQMERALVRSVRTGVFFVLLMPLIVTSETLFPFVVGKALYSRAIIEVTFALWVVLAYMSPSYRPPRSWLLIAFGVYLGIAVLAGLFGVSIQRSLWSTYERMQGIVDLAHWFVLTIVMVSVFRSFLHWRVLLNFNLGVSVVVALLGVAESFGIRVLPFYDFLLTDRRVDITLGNTTYVGAYMLVNVLVGLGFLTQSLMSGSRWPGQLQSTDAEADPRQSRARSRTSQRRKRRRREAPSRSWASPVIWWRVFWGVAVVLDFWVLTLSGTRGAIIGLSAGVVAFAVGYTIWGQLRVVRFAALSLIGLLLAFGLLFTFAKDSAVVQGLASSNVMARRIATVGLDDSSVRGRLASLSTGLQGFAARPVLGWGPENFTIIFGRYFDADPSIQETFDQAHNKLVEELATKGVLGFLSYAAMWGIMSWTVIRQVRGRNVHNQLFVLFVGAALAGYFVQNLFLFDTPGTVLGFMLLLGFTVFLESVQGAGPLEAADEERVEPPRPAAVARSSSELRDRLLPLVASGVGVLLLLTLYFANFRLYAASTAIVHTVDPSITWAERRGYFRQSIDYFPALANYPRIILFAQTFEDWKNITPDEARKTMAMVDGEAEAAIRGEPQSWRIYANLARLYQEASSLDPGYQSQAAFYFNRASLLAPAMVRAAGPEEEDE